MRVLQVSWEYPPVIEGGLGRHVAKLTDQLAADGHDVQVLTRGDCGDADGVYRIEMPPRGHNLDNFLPWIARMNAQLAERGEELTGFDVVHSHDWLVAEAAEQIAREAGVPWLVTVHATEFGRHNGWVYTHPQREIHLAERHMVRHADRVITCSEYMRGHVSRVFGVDDERLALIPNGIDTDAVAPLPGTDLTALRGRYAGPEQPLVVMVGRLVYEKGFHVALQAIADVRAQGVPIRWVLAGTGPEEQSLRDQAAAAGLSASGRLVGRVNDALLHALYAVADVVVVPSLFEPFGIVPLEAMAAGAPVIASDTGGLREVLPDTYRVRPGDTAGLAATLSATLRGPKLVGSPDARFSWPAIADETVGVYESLVGALARV